jgi:hypothetical protein
MSKKIFNKKADKFNIVNIEFIDKDSNKNTDNYNKFVSDGDE